MNLSLMFRSTAEIPDSKLTKWARVVLNDITRNRRNPERLLRTFVARCFYGLITELANNPAPTFVDLARRIASDEKRTSGITNIKKKTDVQLLENPNFQRLVADIHEVSNQIEFFTNYLDRNPTKQRAIVPQTDQRGKKIGWMISATIEQVVEVNEQRDKAKGYIEEGLVKSAAMRLNVLDNQKALAAGASR